jgi:hypothetical protein
LLRPASQEDTRTPAGPGFGKLRRIYQFAAQVVNAIGVSFGIDFSHMLPAQFTQPDQITPYNHATMFTGVHWDTLDSDSNLDNMLCWQVTRPYPATIAALGGFMNTEERP